MITDAGELPLLDFGVAKLLDQPPPEVPPAEGPPPAPGLTGGGALVGTPLHLAPETLAGEPATVRSDVYALGVLRHELCVGRLPGAQSQDGASTLDLRQRESAPAAPALAELEGVGIDPRLCALIRRGLEPHPSLRFASAGEVRDALEALLPECPGPIHLPDPSDLLHEDSCAMKLPPGPRCQVRMSNRSYMQLGR